MHLPLRESEQVSSPQAIFGPGALELWTLVCLFLPRDKQLGGRGRGLLSGRRGVSRSADLTTLTKRFRHHVRSDSRPAVPSTFHPGTHLKRFLFLLWFWFWFWSGFRGAECRLVAELERRCCSQLTFTTVCVCVCVETKYNHQLPT